MKQRETGILSGALRLFAIRLLPGRGFLRAWIAILATLSFPSVLEGRGDGTFKGLLRVELPVGAVGVAAGDFHGDGRLSLATVHNSNEVNVLHPGSGGLGDWTLQRLQTVGQACFFTRAVDLDRDGCDDLIVADPETAGYIFRGQKDGTFAKPITIQPALGPRAVTVGDYDRDGVLDLATVNHPTNIISILGGLGNGTFVSLGEIQLGEFDHNHDMDNIDYDGDGLLDLIVATDFTGFYPLKGGGDGRFEIQPSVNNLETFVVFVGAADFNNDGLGDLVSQARLGDISYFTCIGIGRGDGTFERKQDFQGFSCMPARVDLNDDGLVDLLVTTQLAVGTRLDAYAGDGTGMFSLAKSFAASSGALTRLGSQVIAVDLDQDGKLDAVIADASSPSLLIARGAGKDLLFEGIPLLKHSMNAKGIAMGDFDRDGWPDVFLNSTAISRVNVYLKPGAGLQEDPYVSIATPKPFTYFEAADLDGDGIVDIAGSVLAGGAAGDSLLVLFLDGDGKIADQKEVTGLSIPARVLVTQIDGDEKLDLAAACTGSNEIVLVPNLGARAFGEARRVPTVTRPKDLAAADLDGDGHKDLLVSASSVLAVHFGTEGGYFDPVTIDDGSLRTFTDVAVADVDLDGFLDALVCDSRAGGIRLCRGLGARLFEPSRLIKVVPVPGHLALSDVNDDGLLDLVTSSSIGSAITVLLNRGTKGFDSGAAYQTGFAVTGFRLADIDVDGTEDVILFDSSSLGFLMGNTAAPGWGEFRRGDSDGSGSMDLTDAVVVLKFLFMGEDRLACEDPADSNDDGRVELTDAVVILSRLFLGAAPLPPPGSDSCGIDPTSDPLPGCVGICAQ